MFEEQITENIEAGAPDIRYNAGDIGMGQPQDEQGKHLPDQITKERRKRDQINIHRQQHQFDAHQHDDDIFTIKKQAKDANDKQRSRHCQIMF